MVSMTAFFTHCWRNARLDLAAVLACACLAVGFPQAARAQSAAVEITQFRTERSSEGVFVSAVIKFDLPSAVEDALLKGVPLFFVAEADLYRDRWYWTDKKVITSQRHIRLAYLPLTRRWRTNVASGVMSGNSLGVTLSQSFDSLADALTSLQRLSGWKIAEPSDIDADSRHNIELRFRLDVTQLPRPFQIGTLGQSDWDISATAAQRLRMEIDK
ncbi:MAG: hypothetical protein RIS34_2072 [Pseudomonadota bacterium]|jgi:hypothetical protein